LNNPLLLHYWRISGVAKSSSRLGIPSWWAISDGGLICAAVLLPLCMAISVHALVAQVLGLIE